MEVQIQSPLSALRRRTLFSATLSVLATLLTGVSSAPAATKTIVNNDLTQPASYSPTGLPADGDDLSIVSFANISQPLRLDGSAVLTASSLTSNTSTSVSIINGGLGVSTINLTGSTFAGTVPVVLANPSGDMTVTGMTLTAGGGGVGFLDLALARPGRIVGGSGQHLWISSAIDTGGNTLRVEGAAKIYIGQALSPNASVISDPANYGGISGGGGLTVNGASLELYGRHTYRGTTTITSGSLAIGGTINSSAGIVNNGSLLLNDPAVFIGQSAAGITQAVTPVISGTGTLRKTGISTRTVGPANTYAGVTSIESGVLSTSTLADGGLASGLGASTNAAANLSIANATLRYTGGTTSTNRLFTTSQSVLPTGTPTPPATLLTQIESSGSGALTFSNAGAIAFDRADVARTVSLGGTNTDLNVFKPQITNNGAGAVSLAKTGAGTWRMTGSNSFTGGTFVYGGTLLSPGLSGLGTGTTYIGPAGAVGLDFAINNNQLTPGKFTGPGTVLLGGNATETIPISFATHANSANLVLGVQAGRTQTLTGNITPANNTYRLGGGGGTLVLTSALINAASNGAARSLVIGVPLQQTTTGTIVDIPDSSTPAGSRVVLNGANTFAGGTTVNSGIVEMGNAGALGSGGITLNGNGTLVAFGEPTQALLDRVASTSKGAFAFNGSSAADLNFANAGTTSLGSTTTADYSGVLTPNGSTYRLGGGGGTLTYNSPLSNAIANTLAVSGNGLASSTVVLNNTSNVANVNVTDAKLALGENGSLGNAAVKLTGAATLDLGGKNVSINSLQFLRNGQPTIDATLKNGQLTVNSLFTGVATPFDNAPIPTAQKVSIDFSGLSKLTASFASNFSLVASSGLDSTIRLANENVLTGNTAIVLGSASGSNSIQPKALIELGQKNTIGATTIDLGTQAGSVPQTMIRFPTGTPGTLTIGGQVPGSPASNIFVRSGSFSDTTLDLTNGTSDIRATNFYVGRHGYALGTKTTVRVGGENSLLNLGALVIGNTGTLFDLYTLPAGTYVSGQADDTFEHQAGTVLAANLYFSQTPGGTNGARDTMKSTYTLGTATSSATLSTNRIHVGGPKQTAAFTAKSRATIDFVNGKIETFNPAYATNGATPASPIVVDQGMSIIRGAQGGGVANDYRTLMINLASTGTHSFVANAGKTLLVDPTAVIAGPGGLSIDGPGFVHFLGANAYAGLSTINSGTLILGPAAQNVILAGGGADVRSGYLVLQPAADPAAQQSLVRSLLAASYATGFTAGQFRSGTATADRGLGLRVNGNTLTVTPAVYGDADLNGVVDFNDFLNLQNGFGANGGWQGGDFNYDGIADFNDFLVLQNHFGNTLGGASVPASAAERAALSAFAASVPEPTMTATLMLAAGVLHRRRRPHA